LLSSFILLACSGGALRAVEVGHVDDFESGTAGWQGAGPSVVNTGGPAGEGDAYLRIVANGGNGPGSRASTHNLGSAWIGDYAAAGITAIELDLMNMVTSPGPLSMRLALFGPSSISNRWTSTEAVTIPNDGQWQHVVFPIDADSISRAAGNATYEDMLENIVRVMIRHDTGTPDATGTPVTATFGMDNVMLVGAVAQVSDFNGDGVVDVQDINLLLGEIRSGTDIERFDVTGDGLLNDQDILFVVTSPDQLNSYIGDANLDGEFNSSDLVVVLSGGQYEDGVAFNSAWDTGDWNGDGEFDTGDLVFALQQGGYEAGPRAAALALPVPEPATSLLLLLGTGMLCRRPARPFTLPGSARK
jgi:hypothetical protein